LTIKTPPTTDSHRPDELNDPPGYHLLQTLSPQQTFLCTDDLSNLLVFKRLEPDCIHRDQLHPSIRHRLTKVRELAHPRIATLRTAHHYAGFPCLLWTYLDGQTWDQVIPTAGEDRLRLCREFAAAVGGLHENGIVHGSLHGRNVIVRQGGQVWLTHISPYLYTNPQADVQALVSLLRSAVTDRSHELPVPLSLLESQLYTLETGQISPRDFSHTFAISKQPPQLSQGAHRVDARRSYRASSLALAASLLITAALLWWELHHFAQRSQSLPSPAFPSPIIAGSQH
jgi:hypothetical protein